ncbi:hypothetical protein AAFF_G00019740 [Aldrovandia affinis]|uniref:Uncharacterized protein n=1 Tax=Aldrovandia affinis TaxID=143900 RepID=A0AAD7S608_9TELE|nr:hypothetical protein AAFF_G00019740 [Aldrovandia affinis]
MFTTQSRVEQSEVRHLTSGNWEVTKVLAYDESNHNVYFLSTEYSAQRRYLFSTAHCAFFKADISPDHQHVVLHCEGPGVPTVVLFSLNNANYSVILENNTVLKTALRNKRIQQTEFKTVPIEHFDLPLRISYPTDFSESQKYGLLMVVDGAPGSQSVNDRFLLDWDSALVSSDNVIAARLDGRGTGYQGQRVLQEVHQRLGTVEVQDHIAAIEYMLKFPYIDRTRIGIFGRGYGGYITLRILKSAESLVKCAVAVSPVTDWKFYASAFSERYLGMPTSNDNKYQLSSVLQNVHVLREHNFMLVHGTADANVHFQHSAELIKHLIRVGANYTMQIYPDEGHFLSRNSHQHLYSSLVTFFRECLKEDLLLMAQEPEEEE